MILLDPDLEPPATADASKTTSARQSGVSGRKVSSQNSTLTIARDVRLPSARTLARFLAAAQSAVRLQGQVTVLLTTDAAIRRLNKQFRGKNKATDVLSFPAEGLGAEEMAGDLAISVTTALGQAAEQGHSLSTEIKVLVLHGLLHLAGYDHEADEGQMARREARLRAELRLPAGLIERVSDPSRHPRKKRASGAKALAGSQSVNVRAEARTLRDRSGKPGGVAKQDTLRGLKPGTSARPQLARLKPGPSQAEGPAVKPVQTKATGKAKRV
jgi:probable rRNA maturation factor